MDRNYAAYAVTGIPLPFMSYARSSLAPPLIAIGLVL